MRIAEYKKIRQKLIDLLIEKYGVEKLEEDPLANAIIFSNIGGRDETEINDEVAKKRLALLTSFLDSEAVSETALTYSESCLMLNERRHSRELSPPVFLFVLEKSSDNQFLLSEERLQSLRDQNITEVCLFANTTDYRLRDIAALTHIRTFLEEQGIIVNCIATPADAAWHIPLFVLEDFYFSSFNKSARSINTLLTQEKFKKIAQLFPAFDFCRNKPGIAFHHVDDDSDLRQMALRAHWAIHIMSSLKPDVYISPKAFAIAQLVEHYKNLRRDVIVLEESHVPTSRRCVIC